MRSFGLKRWGVAKTYIHICAQVEIARLEEVKRAMMKELILETRGKLDEVWVAMRYAHAFSL